MTRGTLARVGIVNADGTDGYSIVYEYSDGTQASAHGWYSTIEAAREAISRDLPDEYQSIPVEDWTES